MDSILKNYATTTRLTRFNMNRYTVIMTNTTTYEFEVEANSEDEAYSLTADFGRDELEDVILDNVWEVEIN